MNSIQVGVDIATSISIIFAAVSFLHSLRKSRKLSEVQYSVTNLQGFLTYMREATKEYDDIGNRFRKKMSGISEADLQERESIHYVREHILDVVLFIEGIQRELEAQLEIYFPVFSPNNKAPESLFGHKKIFSGLLDGLRNSEVEDAAKNLTIIEPSMKDLEIDIARELEKILKTM